MSLPDLHVIYGSQTGNAESIAKDFAEQLLLKDIPNKVMSLNTFKSVPLPTQDEKFLMIIVCSTTGNGDCPENADGWWRNTKLRSAVSRIFSIFLYIIDVLMAVM